MPKSGSIFQHVVHNNGGVACLATNLKFDVALQISWYDFQIQVILDINSQLEAMYLVEIL